MIEIAFDEHMDDTFKGGVYPSLGVPKLIDASFEQYLNYAERIFSIYTDSLYLIIKTDEKCFNTNKLALAFFIKSCFYPNNNLECVVFKTLNTNKAFETYKPYVAASIGIKYALRLSKENVHNIYKELKCLNYLNFTIKESFLNNTLFYQPNNLTSTLIETHSAFEAIVFVSLLKILSLAEINIPYALTVHLTTQNENLDSHIILQELIKHLSCYIDL